MNIEDQGSIVDEQQGSVDRMIPEVDQPHDIFPNYGV